MVDVTTMLTELTVDPQALRLIPLSQVLLDSAPPTRHDRGRWPIFLRF